MNVSIGMPVYNGAKYIREALDSLLAQTYTEFELIISDNASTDDTQSICEEYAKNDVRIRYIRQSENIGPMKNFQYVLDEAVGEYFMWAAHDDVWSKNWIETLLLEFKEDSFLVGAYGKLLHIDDKSNSFEHMANGKTLEYKGIHRRLKYYLEPEELGKANIFYALFKKEILKKMDLEHLEYDFQALYGLLHHGSFTQNNNCSLQKRVHTESLAPPVSSIEKLSILQKLYKVSTYPVKNIYFLLGCYLKESNILEQLILILLYPIKISYWFINIIKSKIKRL